MVISDNELNILKNLIVGKSIAKVLEILKASEEEIGLIGVKSNETYTNNVWDNNADKIIHYYTSNIHRPCKRRLRKKIELLNAKKGFAIPQDQLIAKKQAKPTPEQKPKKTTLSLAKQEAIEKEAKHNIYVYFQRLNYAKEIFKIYNSPDVFTNLKNHMLELYESDKEVYNRILRKKNFDGLCKCLPKMNSTKTAIKLFEFKKRNSEDHSNDDRNSIHAISIPMGGKNN
ncbi:hypothetical protein ACT3CE_14490 [Marinifilum sp. RC60d5]|uniref:hypothetical protein n=1 Tax=Marinifilum sp. RC60d5 TaxID=3458414 RepID=UPI0040357722